MSQRRQANDESRGPVDMHVHFVGNGSSAHASRLALKAWQYPLAGLMLRETGIGAATLHQNLDVIYESKLAQLLAGSSLSALVLLAQDDVYSDRGERLPHRGAFYVPNGQVLELGRRHAGFLPGVSIHPGRPDAMDELERCLAGGAVLMKCLPNCQNIDCRLPRYRTFWDRMAEAGLPLLAHTGGEHTLPVVRRELADPATLEPVLDRGVTVIAAHCGTKSGLFDPDYFDRFAMLACKHVNLYGDTSAFNVPIRNRHARECLEGSLQRKLVHGSDFPVPAKAIWARMRGLITHEAYLACRNISNPLERDYRLKQAMGFGPDHFTRIWDLIPNTTRETGRIAAG